jgi:integrase
MALVAKGVQLVKYKTVDGIAYKYRVQVKRKDFKLDRLFNTLEEAIECVNLTKTEIGKNSLLVKSEREEQIESIFKTQNLDFWIEKYIELYLPEIKEKGKMLEREMILKQRNRVAKLSFLKNIRNCLIEDRYSLDKFKKSSASNEDFLILKDLIKFGKKRLGDFKPQEITYIQINDYIRERLNSVKKISVSREITMISNVFNKSKHMSNQFENLQNPTRDYDKSLLAGSVEKRDFRFREEELERLLNALKAMKNPETYQITMISLLTAMRKSEVCLLEWTRIFLDKNYILLEKTKSGKSRKVFLTEEAKQFIQSIEKVEDKNELFTLKIYGYDRNFNRIKEKIGLNHIRIHDLRREAISRFVESMNNASSVYVGAFLGISSQRKVNEYIEQSREVKLTNQEELLKSIGHSSSSTTADFYYSKK